MGFKKGHKTWNKGGLPPHLRKALILRNKKRVGAKHYMWKGDKVGYDALHDWVDRKKGKPIKCIKCGDKPKSAYRIHWANKSGKYKREVSDWISLCVCCHAKYDKWWIKRKRDKNGRFL